MDAVTKVISFTKPFAVSCSCGKILSPSQVHWLKNVVENLWRARSFISPRSSLKIEKSGSRYWYCIKLLRVFYKIVKRSNFYLFDDFGEIPDCVKSLKSYNEYRKLASTMKKIHKVVKDHSTEMFQRVLVVWEHTTKTIVMWKLIDNAKN